MQPIEPIKGFYCHDPNEPITLRRDEFIIRAAESVKRTGTLKFVFLPRPRVVLSLEEAPLVLPNEIKVRLLNCHQEADFLCASSQLGLRVGAEPFIQTNYVLQGSWRISSGGSERVLAHIANFHHFIGRRLKFNDGFYAGRLEFAAGNWKITIDALPDIAKRVEYLHDSGGFAITHVCESTTIGWPADAS